MTPIECFVRFADVTNTMVWEEVVYAEDVRCQPVTIRTRLLSKERVEVLRESLMTVNPKLYDENLSRFVYR